MKRSLKYLIVLMMTAELLIYVIPLLKSGSTEWTLLDLLKTGFEKIESVYLGIFFAVLILAASFLTFIQENKNVYIFSIVSQIAVNIFAILLYRKIASEISDFGDASALRSIGNGIVLEKTPMTIWVLWQVLICVVIVCGLLLNKKKKGYQEIIFPENFGRDNPWEDLNINKSGSLGDEGKTIQDEETVLIDRNRNIQDENEKQRKDTRYCAQCGERLEEGTVFCPQCGVRIRRKKRDHEEV